MVEQLILENGQGGEMDNVSQGVDWKGVFASETAALTEAQVAPLAYQIDGAVEALKEKNLQNLGMEQAKKLLEKIVLALQKRYPFINRENAFVNFIDYNIRVPDAPMILDKLVVVPFYRGGLPGGSLVARFSLTALGTWHVGYEIIGVNQRVNEDENVETNVNGKWLPVKPDFRVMDSVR